MDSWNRFWNRLDENFPYKTKKYVDVKDGRLGCVHMLAMLAIIAYVLGRTILYNNEHLALIPVFGSVRLSIQQPTKQCNPLKRECDSDLRQLSETQYCSNYTGKDPASIQLPCVRMDGIDLTGKETTPGVFFIPTRFTTFEQKRVSECKDTCNNVWEFVQTPKNNSYIHDVERFTLILDHGYFTIGSIGEVATGSSADAHALLERCKVASHPILRAGDESSKVTENRTSSCAIPKRSKGRNQVCSAFPSAISFPSGDVISVGDLLKLSDPLEREGEDILSLLVDGMMLRQEGAVLMAYMNSKKWDPLGKAPVRYVISSTLMPMREYKRMYKEAESNGRRTVSSAHGLLIEARVQGRIRSFSLQHLLMRLTTAMALVALSTTITDALMLYAMSDRDKFYILKYQPAQQFKEMRVLQAAQKKEKGQIYSETEFKPTPTADFLSDIFEKAHTDGKHLPERMKEYKERVYESSERLFEDGKSNWLLDNLAVAIRHEQRLNRLDAVDENNLGRGSTGERMAQFYADWEDAYWSDHYGEEVHKAVGLRNRSQPSASAPGYQYVPLSARESNWKKCENVPRL